MLVRTTLVGFFIAAAIAVSACGDADQARRFETPVAAAQEAGLTPYWLGPTVDAGSVTFDAIEGQHPQGLSGIPLMGIKLTYSSAAESWGHLDVSTFGLDSWDSHAEDVDRLLMQPRDAGIGIERKEVTVLGTAADLLAITTDGRFNGYRLVLRLPNQVVVAQTTAAVNAGVQVNPLMDEAAFLEALENLQPYPN